MSTEMVEVHYEGERALKKPDPKTGKLAYSANRVITVKGKPYRMTEGVHVMPKKDYDAFASTPVGKILCERGAIKCRKADKAKTKKEAEPKPKPKLDADEKAAAKKEKKGKK